MWDKMDAIVVKLWSGHYAESEISDDLPSPLLYLHSDHDDTAVINAAKLIKRTYMA